MAEYRCYILDADDHIVLAHDVDCDTDAQAESTAAGLLARDPYHGSVEIWCATRRVTKLERAAARYLPLAHWMPSAAE
jgi:hypothetical protein